METSIAIGGCRIGPLLVCHKKQKIRFVTGSTIAGAGNGRSERASRNGTKRLATG
jgi:hypothetical protein